MSTVYGQYAAYGLGTDTADDWRALGLCRQADPELWFPLGGLGNQRRTGANLDQELRAKAVCQLCPVMAQCGKEAIARGEEHGIFGGLNERERRELGAPKRELSAGRRHALERSAQVRAERVVSRTHCDEGHEMTSENTISDRGSRKCRTCRAVQQREYRLKQVANA